ncbi:MAG: hypothetical protein WC011_03275 [Candidatus Paceibacterota bacterium]
MLEKFSELNVVGVITPSSPTQGRGLIKARPDRALLKSFQEKNIFFAETSIKTMDFLNFFICPSFGGARFGLYTVLKNADILYKNNLFAGSTLVFENIDYTILLKNILSLENELVQNTLLKEKMLIKTRLIFKNTFEQGKFLLNRIEDPEKSVLYVNFTTGYAIHLLTGCHFFEDTYGCTGEEKDKLKKDIDLLFKIYQNKEELNALFMQKPNIQGSFSKDHSFEVYSKNILENTEVEGFIFSDRGLQYFEGTKESNILKINAQYIASKTIAPSRMNLIDCRFKKEILLDLEKQKGKFVRSVKEFSFKIND